MVPALGQRNVKLPFWHSLFRCCRRALRCPCETALHMNSKPSIALVHPERNILSSLGLAFEAEGFDVRTYCDGIQALDALSDAPADIAILGRRLPRLPGPDLFRQLRYFTAMPVIFVSSLGPDLAEQAPDADDYLETPFSLRLVVERARTVLRRHQMARSAAVPPPVTLSGGLLIERP